MATVQSFLRLQRQLEREFLVPFLMSRGVLPSFAFPVDVTELHVLAQEMNPARGWDSAPLLRFERDMRIALGEYAPGAEVVAGRSVYRSVGLRKFRALEFDGTNWFRLCPRCNALELYRTEEVDDIAAECGSCGHELPAFAREARQWVQPRWGFVTDVRAKRRRPGGRRPEQLTTTRSFFLGARPGAEGAADAEGGRSLVARAAPELPGEVYVAGVAAAGRTLLVLNLGEHNPRGGRSGFRVCGTCGRADFDGSNTTRRHAAPYHREGRFCTGPIGIPGGLDHEPDGSPVALGHRYETDVAWLDLHGADPQDGADPGFWLSVAYALANAAALELNIERNDLEATVVPQGPDRQAVVIYDAVPGGAGHARRIVEELPAVIRRTRDLLAGCTSCDPDSTGCYDCLCDYRNQFAHDILKRGPALRYLSRLCDAIEQGGDDPWRRVGPAPARELYDALALATGPVVLTVQRISADPLPRLGVDWLDVLLRLARRPGGGQLTVHLGTLPDKGLDASNDPVQHLTFARLAELQRLGASLFHVTGQPAFASFTLDDGHGTPVVWRWPWERELAPDVPAQRNRLGRHADALAGLPAPAAKPLGKLTQPLRYGQFTLQPGAHQNVWHSAYLGELLDRLPRQILMVDPHLLRSDRERGVLSRFLLNCDRRRRVQHVQTEIRVLVGPVKAQPFYHDYQTQADQDVAANRLRQQFAGLNFRLTIPVNRLGDHDRRMLIHTRDGRYYHVLLGQGLYGFEDFARDQSTGVWLEIGREEYEERARAFAALEGGTGFP